MTDDLKLVERLRSHVAAAKLTQQDKSKVFTVIAEAASAIERLVRGLGLSMPPNLAEEVEVFAARHAVAMWDPSPAEVERAKRQVASDLTDTAIKLAQPYRRRAEAAETEQVRLAKLVAEMREVLEPFAKAAQVMPVDLPGHTLLFGHYPSHFGGQTEIRVGDLRRARALLQRTQEQVG